MNEELKIIISAEIDKLKQELGKAQGEVKGFTTKSQSSFKSFGKAAGAAGKAVAVGMAAAAAAVAAGAAALVGLAESTKEYRTEQAKLTSAFQAAGSSAETAKETYNDLYRVLGDSGQAVEAAGHLAKLTTNEKDLAEWTKVCQGVYATFGDSIPIESLTEAANETAKTGEITGALADALNWAGVSEDEFAEQLFWCNTEAEREKLIRTTLNDLYGDAAAAYETNAASILAANEAQAALTESLAKLGEVAEPIVTIFKSELATTLADMVPSIEKVAAGLSDMMNGVPGGAEKMSQGITELLTGLVDKLVALLPSILSIGVDVIAALITGIASALPDVINAIVGVLPAVIDGIVKAVGALAAALPDIIAAIVNALPSLVTALVDGAVALVLAVISNLQAIIDPIINVIPTLITSILDAVFTNLPILLEGVIKVVVGKAGLE